MRWTVTTAAACLLACTPDQPTEPPSSEPVLRGRLAPAGGDAPASPVPAPALAEQPAPAVTTATAGAGDDDPLEAIAPRSGRAGLPGPRGTRSGCEGGARSPGETWKVDCNACSCGDDGQVTCTAMACGYR